MAVFERILDSVYWGKAGVHEKKPATRDTQKLATQITTNPDLWKTSEKADSEFNFDTRDLEFRLNIDDFISVWSSCEGLHGELCNPPPTSPPENFRVVDINLQCVVAIPMDHRVRYVALSYVWGAPDSKKSQPLRLTMENCAALERHFALNREVLPETIIDAISFCGSIKERYLWIDRLCIVQNDASSKHQQIQQMTSIYQNAALTIIAASGKDTSSGLPGIRSRRQSVMEKTNAFEVDVGKSIWNERAWTFQEHLLSRKCVFFTPFQVYFQCRKGFWFELDPIGYPSNHEIKHLLSNDRLPLDNFGKAVTEYNTRKITYPSDILNAFLGVGTVLADALDTTLLLGLPESRLIWGLLWLSIGACTKRIGVDYPSWTWLSWNCHVGFLKDGFGQSDLDIYHQDPAMGLRQVARFNKAQRYPASIPFPDTTVSMAQKWQGCLVFTTTLLPYKLSCVYSTNGALDSTIKDIHGDIVGHLWVPRLPEKDLFGRNAGGLVALAMKKKKRVHAYLDKSQVYVMLIKRCDGVASRIGVGWIYKYWWDQAETVTETIVLI